MPEKPLEKRQRSFWSFWGEAVKIGWEESREKFGVVVDITLFLTAVGLFVLAWYSKRHGNFNRERSEANMSYWFAVIPVGLWLMWFVYHVFKAPYEIYKRLSEKYESDLDSKDATIEQLSNEIRVIKEAMPELELLPALSDTDAEGRCFCGVTIKNKSKTATARLVKVELLRIDPAPELKVYSFWTGDVPYPFSLKPSDPEGHTIHPGCASKFNIFCADRISMTKNGIEMAFNIVVDFVGRPRILTENPELPKFKMTGFRPESADKNKPPREYKNYSVKIRASAEDAPAVEKEFGIFFTLDLSQDAIQIYEKHPEKRDTKTLD